jgi:hypothetical protein
MRYHQTKSREQNSKGAESYPIPNTRDQIRKPKAFSDSEYYNCNYVGLKDCTSKWLHLK